jgi:hypothetical protein
MVFATKNLCYFCLLLSNVYASSVEIRSVFKSSSRIRWHVPYERPNLPAISEIVLRRPSSTILWICSMLLVCAICGTITLTLAIFNQNFPAFTVRKLRVSITRDLGGGGGGLAGTNYRGPIVLKRARSLNMLYYLFWLLARSPLLVLVCWWGGGNNCFSGPVPPIGGPENFLKIPVLLSPLSLETVFSIRCVLEAFIRVRGNT